MFKIGIIVLTISSVTTFASYVHLGKGGQVVQCFGFSSVNTSLVSLYGQRKWNLKPAHLGKTLEEALQNIANRLKKLSPSRLERVSGIEFNFKEYTQFVSDVELYNQQDWDESITKGCNLQKIILSRRPRFENEKPHLINQDLWSHLTPSTQATLLWEQDLLSGESIWESDVERIRPLLAFLTSEQAQSATFVDFLKFTSSIQYHWLDFYGAAVNWVDLNQTPIPTELKIQYQSNNCIWIRQHCYLIRHGDTISIDQQLKPREIKLDRYHDHFEMGNGQMVNLSGTLGENNRIAFDENGYVLSGELYETQDFKTISGENVTCIRQHRIEFNSQGEVTQCTLVTQSQVGSKVLLQPTPIRWCQSGQECPNEIKSYYDLDKKIGRFELIDFPMRGNSIVLEITDYKKGSYYTNNSDYGDFVLTLTKGPKYFPSTINVFDLGVLAQAEILKPITIDFYEWSKKISLKVAGSGKCPRSSKSFKSIVKYSRPFERVDENYYLTKVILAEKVTLKDEDSITKPKVFGPYEELELNNRGYVKESFYNPFECY